jgi:phosphoribosylglycinamide formyltransferase-1
VEPGEVDSGPIILQAAIELPGATDPAEVLAALRPLEHTLLPRAVALIAGGAVRRDPDHPRRVVVGEAVGAASAGPTARGASPQ